MLTGTSDVQSERVLDANASETRDESTVSYSLWAFNCEIWGSADWVCVCWSQVLGWACFILKCRLWGTRFLLVSLNRLSSATFRYKLTSDEPDLRCRSFLSALKRSMILLFLLVLPHFWLGGVIVSKFCVFPAKCLLPVANYVIMLQ